MPLDDLDIYILKPKAATNLVTNPSFETNTTGYTVVAGSFARSTTYQRRGRYSLEVTPNSGVESGAYFGTVSLTISLIYSFSCDVLGVAGQAMRIQIRSTGGSMLAETTFTATGYWQRVNVSYTETASNSRRLYLVRDAVASTAKFYLDSWQCELGNQSSYIDGDLKGYISNSIDYGWNGAAHASTSWRTNQTRHGGELVKLNTFCSILAIIGLGMSPITLVDTPVSTGGALYQRSSLEVREFTIPVLFNGSRWADIQSARKNIIDLVRPDSVEIQQPLTLVFQGKTNTGQENMDRVVVPAVYQAGLEGSINNQKAEIVNLQFRQYFPLILGDGEKAVSLSIDQNVSVTYMARRTSDGTWQSVGTISGTKVSVIKRNPVDGKIYCGGTSVTSWGGVSTNNIAVYDPAANSWAALGSGASGGTFVTGIDFDASGNVYAVGNFTSMGGAANSANIARWNIASSTWTGLNSGLAGTSPYLADVTVGVNGYIYVAGNFTSINGVAANHVAVYNGATWSAMGWSGALGIHITSDRNGTIYMAHAGSPLVSFYTGSWHSTNWNTINAITPPNVLQVDPQGRVLAGLVSVYALGGTDGDVFSLLIEAGAPSSIGAIHFDKLGRMWLGGDIYFDLLGGSSSIVGARMDGSTTVIPIGINTPTIKTVLTMATTPAGDLLIGGAFSGTAISSTVAAVNNSSAVTYPTFKITGPGKLWTITNYTTGKSMIFNNLVLVAGETVQISLTPGNIFAVSSFRGNIMPYFAAGTDLDFPLVPGTNNVSAYMTDTGGNGLAIMYQQDAYWSLDGASR